MTTQIVLVDGTGCGRDAGTAIGRLAQATRHASDTRLASGTTYWPGLGSNLGSRLRGNRIAGLGISRQVKAIYGHLCLVLRPGTELALIGYSRGGSAVLSLANLIDRCGLVETWSTDDSLGAAQRAMGVYRRREGYRNWAAQQLARQPGHWRPRIAFLGVFDAVGALGMGMPRPLARALVGYHELELPDAVECAAQALAADEDRWAFRPAVWSADANGRMIAQCWFEGRHGDIGGAQAEDSVRWMLACARSAGIDLPDIAPAAPRNEPPRSLLPRRRRIPEYGPIASSMLTGECVHERMGVNRRVVDLPWASEEHPWTLSPAG